MVLLSWETCSGYWILCSTNQHFKIKLFYIFRTGWWVTKTLDSLKRIRISTWPRVSWKLLPVAFTFSQQVSWKALSNSFPRSKLTRKLFITLQSVFSCIFDYELMSIWIMDYKYSWMFGNKDRVVLNLS